MKNPKHVFDIQKLINGEYSSKELRDKCEELKMEREVVNAVGPFFNISIIKALKSKHINREDALSLLANLVNMRIEEYMSTGDASETIEKLEHDIKLIRNELSEKDLIILARDEQISSLQNSIEDLRKKVKETCNTSVYEDKIKSLDSRYKNMCYQKKKAEDEAKSLNMINLKLQDELNMVKEDLEAMKKAQKPKATPKNKEIAKYNAPYTVTTASMNTSEISSDELENVPAKIVKVHSFEAAEFINLTMDNYVKRNKVTDNMVYDALHYYIFHFLTLEDDVFRYKILLDIEKNLKHSSGKSLRNLPIPEKVEMLDKFNDMITYILKAIENKYGISIKEIFETDCCVNYGDIPIHKEFVIFIVGSLMHYILDPCYKVSNYDRAKLYYSAGCVIMQACNLDTLEFIGYMNLQKICGTPIEIPKDWARLYDGYKKGSMSVKYIAALTRLPVERVYTLLYRTTNGLQKTKGCAAYSSTIRKEVLAYSGIK